MATAFDGLGMGQLGSERRFMTGDNPLGSGLKALKEFGIMYGLEKSGVVGMLNDMGQAKKDMMSKYPGLAPTNAAPPPATQNQPVPPVVQSEPVFQPEVPDNTPSSVGQVLPIDYSSQPIQYDTPPLNPNNGMSVEDAADHSMGIKGSFLSPDTLKTRDPGQDQMATEMATAPPPQLNLPQYGKQGGGGGGGGGDMLSTIATLAKFFI